MRCGFTLLSLLTATQLVFAKDHPYRAPRLDDDQVDLQGVWAHTNLTPLERPKDIQSFVITPQEAAQIKTKVDQRNDDLSKPAEPSLYFDERTVEPIGGQLRSSVVVEPANGMIPGNDLFKQSVAQAKAALFTAFDGPEQRPTSERCLGSMSAAPPVQLVPASDLRRIVQTRDRIVMMSEELHEARVIRMNAVHAPLGITSWLGDSIGRWEDDTLVVETTSFAPSSSLRAGPNGIFMVSPSAIVEERMTRVGSDEIRYEFTVTDPVYYTQPWKGETRFHLAQARMIEYACHEGNYSLTYVLQGARVQEARSAEEKIQEVRNQNADEKVSTAGR